MIGKSGIVQETVGQNTSANDIIRNFPLIVQLPTEYDIAIEIFVLNIGIPRKKNGMTTWRSDKIGRCQRSIRLTRRVNRQEFP